MITRENIINQSYWVDEAIVLADELVRVKKVSDQGAYWECNIRDKFLRNITVSSGSIYSGGAGVILFLLVLHKEKKEYYNTILEAVSWVYSFYTHNECTDYSFINGRMGAAYVMLKVYDLTAEEMYLQYAVELVKKCGVFIKTCKTSDFETGISGVLYVLVQLHVRYEHPEVFQNIQTCLVSLWCTYLNWKLCDSIDQSLSFYRSHIDDWILAVEEVVAYYPHADYMTFLSSLKREQRDFFEVKEYIVTSGSWSRCLTYFMSQSNHDRIFDDNFNETGSFDANVLQAKNTFSKETIGLAFRYMSLGMRKQVFEFFSTPLNIQVKDQNILAGRKCLILLILERRFHKTVYLLRRHFDQEWIKWLDEQKDVKTLDESFSKLVIEMKGSYAQLLVKIYQAEKDIILLKREVDYTYRLLKKRVEIKNNTVLIKVNGWSPSADLTIKKCDHVQLYVVPMSVRPGALNEQLAQGEGFFCLFLGDKRVHFRRQREFCYLLLQKLSNQRTAKLSDLTSEMLELFDCRSEEDRKNVVLVTLNELRKLAYAGIVILG